MVLQALPQDDILGLLVQIGWLGFIVFSIFYGQRLQMWTMLRDVGNSLGRFKVMRDEGRRIAISTMKEVGKPQDDPTARIDQFLEHQIFGPVDMDPAGIVSKFEHVLNIRDVFFEDDVKIMAPEADEAQIHNLENMLGAALILNLIYKIVRHYYLLGKKTMNLYIVMQVQMVLPLLMIEAKAHANALKAFTNGQPIGDGAGPLVAAKLMHGHEKRKIAKEIVMSEVSLEGRTAYVIKAEGPGATVGKPGDAINRIIEKNDGNISTVITIDAQQKFEGERAGKVTEGVGVAIGPGGFVEKYKVDETVLKHKIPVHAVLIKVDLGDAVSVMRKEIIDAADVAVERIKRLIRERTKVGDSVIIAGIGNTSGIGQ